MASFSKYKNKSGEFWKFQTYTTIDPKTGKRRLTTRRGFKTKKEAQLAAEILEKQVRTGTFHNHNLTYEDVYKEWWITHKKTIKPSTISRKESVFNKHILPRFGKVKLKDISRQYCQQMIDDIAKSLNAASSATDVKIQANLVFKYALKQDYIERNPLEHTVIPKKDTDFIASEEEKRNFWRKSEIKAFLESLENSATFQYYVLFYLLIYTGMRKGELIALEWNDINFEEQEIRINKTMFFQNGEEIIQTAKKQASNRTISITDDDIKLLKKWRTAQREFFLGEGKRQGIKNVLTRQDMRPLRLAHPNDLLASHIKKYDLHTINVHGLRHTHASLLFEAGASIKEVQARLGHKDIQTTMNIYTHVTNFTAQKTADTFQKYMKSE